MVNDKREANYINRKYLARGLFSQIYQAEYTGGVSDVKLKKGDLVALKITDLDDEVAPHDSTKELKLLQKFSSQRMQQLTGIESEKNAGIRHVIDILDSYRVEASFDNNLVMVLPLKPYTLDQVMAEYRKPLMKLFDSSSFANDYSNSMTESSYEWINKMPVEFSRQIIHELAQALCFLHSQGIIHRDIKPENILFDSTQMNKEGEYPHICLSDFGIAWIPPDNEDKEPKDHKITDVGSGSYRSPQVLFGIKDYDTSIDMWSLGCVAAQLYSKDTKPVFLNDNSRLSDIALIATIFENIGIPTIETWPEARDIESFIHLSFKTKGKHATDNQDKQEEIYVEGRELKKDLVPLAPTEMRQDILPKLFVYESSNRMTAAQLAVHDYFL